MKNKIVLLKVRGKLCNECYFYDEKQPYCKTANENYDCYGEDLAYIKIAEVKINIVIFTESSFVKNLNSIKLQKYADKIMEELS